MRATRHSKERLRAWATNASRTKANRRRAELGRPLLPLIPVPLSDKPRAVLMRRRRELGRRMCEYDGIKYDDRLASSDRVRIALEEERGGSA